MIVNNYMPLYGMQLAFKSFSYSKGIAGSKWIGFKNFKFLFATKDAFIMVRNTLLYNILWIFVGAVFGITVAILFNEIQNKIAKKFYQTAILLPYLISIVVVAYLVYAFLATDTGLVNNAIVKGLLYSSGNRLDLECFCIWQVFWESTKPIMKQQCWMVQQNGSR